MDLSHIMKLDVERKVGPYIVPAVMLFNENNITAAEAVASLKAGEYNENVLIISRKKWNSLFMNRKEK